MVTTSYIPALLAAGAAGADSSVRQVRAFRELTRGEARGTRTRAIEVCYGGVIRVLDVHVVFDAVYTVGV